MASTAVTWVDAAVGPKPYARRGDLGWAMSAHGSNLDQRRNFVGLSSRSALVASAARRRQLEKPLDGEERASLTGMRDGMRLAVENLRNGFPGGTAPEHTYAFVTLASMTQPPPAKESPARDQLAELLTKWADKLDALTMWDEPADAAIADEVASMFTNLSQVLLRNVARTGEADSGLSRSRT